MTQQLPGKYYTDPNGRLIFVRDPMPEDRGDFWGHPTPDGPLARATQGGQPDIYDQDYFDYFSGNLMFVQTGPEYMPDPGKRDDLGGRDHWNPAAKRRNQGLVPRDQAELQQVITPTDLTLPGEVGQLVQVVGDAPLTYAKKNLRRDSQLVAYSLVDSPDQVTYFSQQGFDPTKPSPLADPVTAVAPNGYFGSTVLVGELTIGHEGVSQKVLFDIPAAQLVKVPFNGIAGQLRARLYPKYYYPNDTVAGVRTYNIGPPTSPLNPALTNNNFNEGPPTQLQSQGFTNPNPARVRGWIAEGSNATDILGRATRSFSGSVPIGVAFATQVQCPIAYYASAVMLRGGQLVAGAAETLEFLITDLQGKQSGPYPANTVIPISNSIESIQVTNSTAVTVTEAPFELIYFISI